MAGNQDKHDLKDKTKAGPLASGNRPPEDRSMEDDSTTQEDTLA